VSRERVLQRKLRALRTLDEAVGALRSLSAQHFRIARALLPAARSYRDEITALLGVLRDPALAAAPGPAGPAGVVLVTADLGLIGDYTARLVHEALALRREIGEGPLLCLGQRAVAPLARAAVRPDRVAPAPTSVASLTGLLLPLVDEILRLREAERLGALWLVAARFEGAGHFRPVRVPLLPVAPPADAPPLAASSYCDPGPLRFIVTREYLVAALYETLLESLASEHGKRLVTAESARSWLAERIEETRRLAASLRRESATQEVLEIAGAARAARRGAAQGRGGGAWPHGA
jgi:F-type H+-transporting ATPase subunit gamma